MTDIENNDNFMHSSLRGKQQSCCYAQLHHSNLKQLKLNNLENGVVDGLSDCKILNSSSNDRLKTKVNPMCCDAIFVVSLAI